jgi:hypothetical protein
MVLLAAILITAIPVAGMVNLFVHQLKPVSAAVIQDNCGGSGLAALSLPPPTGTGNVLFGCYTPVGVAPLGVHTGGGVVGVWLTNASSSVYIVTTNTVPCTGGRQVTEKANFTFTPAQAGNYWYCLEGVSSPTPWVDINWYVN